MKKKILILGGGHSEIPLIEAAKKLGFYVITSGNKLGDLGHKYSDKYIFADFSDNEQILKVAKDEKIDAVCAGCNDFAAISASYVAEKLCLPGNDDLETTLKIHHKDLYRTLAENYGLRTPKAKGFNNKQDAENYASIQTLPLIIKPVDLTGGKGISVIKSRNQIEKAVSSAFEKSKAKRIIVEEFIEGSRHGLSIFITNGKICFYFSDNEHYYLNPYLVSAASTPSQAGKNAEKLICLEAQTLIDGLKLRTGVFHIQYILDRDKKLPYIIEICRRPPGDLYIEFVKISTKVDLPDLIIRNSAGIELPELNRKDSSGFFVRHCIMADRNGVIDRIEYTKEINDKIISTLMWRTEGALIEDYLVDKCGIVFLKFSSLDEMIKLTDNLQELIKVHIKR